MKPTLFIATGPIEFGSSRMRVYWPSKYMQAAEVMDATKPHDEPDWSHYGSVVFQKIWSGEWADNAHAAGCKVIWDVCDPSWWWSPRDVREALYKVDLVTVSSVSLGNDLIEFAGEIAPEVHYIPDCIDPEHFTEKRKHAPVDVLRFVWFGMAQNRQALFSALANLDRLKANGYKFTLTILDDLPEHKVDFAFTVLQERWRLSTEVGALASMDVALLPPYPGPWGFVKSPNKARTARMCGLPVTNGNDYREMCRLFDHEHRAKQAEDNLTVYYAPLVAKEWEMVCNS